MSNEAQSREPFLGLPQPPHPLAQTLAAQHRLRLHQQGVPGRKTWGIRPFYFLLFPALCPGAFCLSLSGVWIPAELRWPKGPIRLCWSSIHQSSYRWQSKLQANRDKLLPKPQEESPLGTSLRCVLLLWHCRVGTRRGSQSLWCLGASRALSVLSAPVTARCPEHPFPAAHCLPAFSCALSFRNRGRV